MTTVLEKIYFSVIVPGELFSYFFLKLNLRIMALTGSLLILMVVMSYYFNYERSVRSQLETNLEERLAENSQNKGSYEKCSEKFVILKKSVEEKMKTIRSIEPHKKEMEQSLKNCKEKLSNI